MIVLVFVVVCVKVVIMDLMCLMVIGLVFCFLGLNKFEGFVFGSLG